MLCLLTANAGVMVAEFVGIATAAELFKVGQHRRRAPHRPPWCGG